MNANLPQTIEKGFLNKIKAWFAKRRKSKNVEISEETKIISDANIQVKEDFLSTIQNQTNIFAQSIQEKLRNGDVRAADLSDDEYEKIIELYDTQIREMSNKIDEYKQKIEKLRKVE